PSRGQLNSGWHGGASLRLGPTFTPTCPWHALPGVSAFESGPQPSLTGREQPAHGLSVWDHPLPTPLPSHLEQTWLVWERTHRETRTVLSSPQKDDQCFFLGERRR